MKRIIILFSIFIFTLHAHSFTPTDILSIACSDSSRVYGVVGVNIRDELKKIQNETENPELTESKIKRLQIAMKNIEGDIYAELSKKRNELFARFGDMMYVDTYILINSGAPTKSFLVAYENPSLNFNQLVQKINSSCISGGLNGMERERNKQR